MSLVLNSDVKRYGAEKIFGGVDVCSATGECLGFEQQLTSLGAQMRELDKGVKFSVPGAGAFDGYREQYAHGWMILFSAECEIYREMSGISHFLEGFQRGVGKVGSGNPTFIGFFPKPRPFH